MTQTLTILAPAKVNLALAVAPPEPALSPRGAPNPRAGWHRICSLFSCVQLADTITIRRCEAGPARCRVRFEDPGIGRVDWPIEKDLAMRAARALEAVHGPLPVEIEVTKRIPTGAGLGGGSSDAAGVLTGVNALLELNRGPGDLRTIGLALGSDVPFFVEDPAGEPAAGPAIVEGFGECLTRVAPLAADVVLIMPPISCPTASVYKAFDRQIASNPGHCFREKEVREIAIRRSDDPRQWSGSLFNDLAEPAFALAPALRELRDACERVHSPIHVTGSGSTLFALVRPGEGEPVAERLRSVVADGVRVLATRLN